MTIRRPGRKKKKKNSQTVDSGLTIYADYTYFYCKKDFL